MFYFSDVEQLTDFDSFEVLPTPRSNGWSVIGKLNVLSSQSIHYLPVADFSCEMRANLFARMCRQLTSDVLQIEVRKAISALI